MVPLPIAVSRALCFANDGNGTFMNGFRSCLPPAWFPSGPDQCAVNDKGERGSTILDPYLHSSRRGLMAMTKCGYNPGTTSRSPNPSSSTSPSFYRLRTHLVYLIAVKGLMFSLVWVSLATKKVEDLMFKITQSLAYEKARLSHLGGWLERR